MNRRNFLKNSALALFGFTVLPSASTYERLWKAEKFKYIRITRINEAWMNALIDKGLMPIPGGLEYLESEDQFRYEFVNGVYRKVYPFIETRRLTPAREIVASTSRLTE